MSPGLTSTDRVHSSRCDITERPRDLVAGLARGMAPSDLEYPLDRQLDRPMTFSAHGCSVPIAIRHVLRFRSPAEILGSIVPALTIQMPRFLALGSQTYESLKHEVVYEVLMVLPVPTQGDAKIAAAFHGVRHHDARNGAELVSCWTAASNARAAFQAEGSDAAEVADLVALKAFDRAPLLTHGGAS